MGGEVYSVRRVSDYLSSHIDLEDYIHKDMGYFSHSTLYVEISEEPCDHKKKLDSMFSRRVFSGEGSSLV